MANKRKEQNKYPAQRGQAMFRPETVDRENRTVEIVFTTGQSGERYDYWDDTAYLEVLEVSDKAVRTERLDKGLSIIDSHNRYAGISGVLGVTEEWRIESGKLIGTARFSKNQQAVFDDVDDGILRHVSLGYRVHEWNIVKAKAGAIETRTAVSWEPLELSIVPVSFETENGMRTAEAERANQATYAVKFNYEEASTMTEEEKRALEEKRIADEASRAAAEKRAAEEKRIAAEKQEKQDAESVRGQLPAYLEASRAAGLGDDVAIEAFTRGDSLDDHRAAVLNKLAETRTAAQVKGHAQHFTSDQRQDHGEAFVRSAGEYLQARTSKQASSKLSDGAREFSGMTLFDMGRELLLARGERVYGMSRQKIAERALHSTSDFSMLLENVMNKNLLEAYAETPRTFQELGRKSTVNDFRDKHLYRLGDAPDLLPLNEHGEYQGGTISESGEKYRIATYARKIGFTRQMMINDDMSALDRMPRLFGAAGSRLESDVVWGLLLNYDFFKGAAANIKMSDGKALFDAAHKNLETGSTSALSKTSLNKLRQLGRLQKTLDGKYMNVQYSHLVVPTDLETTAEDLIFPNILASTIAEQAPRTKLGLVVEPRLDAVSKTAWYAFASMMDTFEFASLAGEDDMYTEAVHSTDIDGLTLNVRKDFGAGLVDWRGMAKANGA